MMHLKDSTISPPGNWKFKHPDGFVSTAITLGSLVRKVSLYRSNNNLPPVSAGYVRLSEEVESAICASLSPEDQLANCDGGSIPPQAIHWTEVKKFLLTMATWALKGFQIVPKEESARRATICVSCPYNMGTAGCGGCKLALAGLRSSILKASTPLEDKLEACGVCGCDNKLQVHIPLDVLHKVSSENLDYPDFCWKKDLVASN